MDQIIDTSRQFLIDSGVEEIEATEFLNELCDAVPAFYGKFCIGVLRWIVDGEIDVESEDELKNLNTLLLVISGTEAGDSYDGNFNGESYADIAATLDLDMDAPEYETPADAKYEVMPVSSYEALQQYRKCVGDWCITQSEMAFRDYSLDGEHKYYVLFRSDYKEVPKKPGKSFPKDSYGSSIYGVIVRGDGSIESITNRWNALEDFGDMNEFLDGILGSEETKLK